MNLANISIQIPHDVLCHGFRRRDRERHFATVAQLRINIA
jgi:hypothetical protein